MELQRQEFEKWLKANYPDYPPPLSEIWNACQQLNDARIAAYKNTIRSKDAEIEKLKLDILDAWMDENGTTWHRPTSWAYAQVCRVKNTLTDQRDSLLAVISQKDEALQACADAMEYMSEYDIPLTLPGQVSSALAIKP